MPEWLIERGIGETRAVCLEDGEIVEARVQLDGTVPAGSVFAARLIDVGTNGRNAVAADEQGLEYLLPQAPRGITQGASLKIEVTREPIPGAETWKRPFARAADEAVGSSPPLDGELLPFPAPLDRLAAAGWADLLDEARSGIIRFAGGELRVSLTPAMTLIDVDGHLAVEELAMAGAEAAARTILRHGIGGSIGIDLPTTTGKTRRQAIGAAVDAILPQPFERTAVNGFGFMQIVRPRTRASLFELAADRAAFEARALLRLAAMQRTGGKAHGAPTPRVCAVERRPGGGGAPPPPKGGAAVLRSDPSLPIHGGYVQAA